MDYTAILQDTESRRAAIFVAVGGILWLIEMVFAMVVHHLGLMMYSLLTLFRVLCVLVSIVGTVLSQTKRTLSFSYGFGRIETVVGFSSCLVTAFGSGYVFLDAIFEILFEPAHPERHPSPGVIPFAMIGLMINISAVFFFSRDVQPHSELIHSHGGHGHSAQHIPHTHTQRRIDFVFSYVMDDLLSCSVVVLATWMSSWGSIFVAEPFSALMCGFLLLRAIKPYGLGYGRVLLQTTPVSLQSEISTRLRQAATIPGVLEVRDEHFWTHTPGVFVGSMKVRTSSEADGQEVLAHVYRLFVPLITHLTINVERMENWGVLGQHGHDHEHREGVQGEGEAGESQSPSISSH